LEKLAMCGITGVFDMVGERPVHRSLLQAMNNAIRHRGPDGEGFFFEAGVGLGHRRLAIIDLSTGDQPMLNAEQTVAIVFNGEIYNFRELRKELTEKYHRSLTSSDTEVILHAWREWGENCVDHFNGMFAFALWDRTKRTLFLARDRLGEKPLYYAFLPDRTFIFGSELKALLVHPLLVRSIDPCAVEEFFALGYIAEPRSIYESVKKLPAGYTLRLSTGREPALRAYWDATPISSRSISLDEAADSLLAQLRAIVDCELVSDVPIGAFLSGGVDSSGTTALMAQASAEPIKCFTIGFDDPRFDETRYAAAVAHRYGAHHITERMKSADPDSIDCLPRIFDEPFGDSSALPSYHVMQLARKHVKVALSGDAGDELFAGYRRYLFHSREERLRSLLPAGIRQPLFGLLSRIYPQMDWLPRIFRARHTFHELSLDSVLGYFWNVSITDDALRTELFTNDLRRSLQCYHASEVISRHWNNAPDTDAVVRAQYVDLKTWLPGDILTKVDRTAMACSLEVRVPMLNHHFVEWALGLPLAMKVANGQGKVILKRAFERLVPAELLHRPKQGFSVPLASWFRGDLGEKFQQEVTSHRQIAKWGFFAPAIVERLVEEHRAGLRDHSRTLWLLWMFHSFLKEVHASPAYDSALQGNDGQCTGTVAVG
jgi:asparagine synthase (glutamine-hydrolysing)